MKNIGFLNLTQNIFSVSNVNANLHYIFKMDSVSAQFVCKYLTFTEMEYYTHFTNAVEFHLDCIIIGHIGFFLRLSRNKYVFKTYILLETLPKNS